MTKSRVSMGKEKRGIKSGSARPAPDATTTDSEPTMMSSPDPGKVIEESMDLFQEMFRIVTGTSDIKPGDGDRRFKDAAWSSHPYYERLGQTYLAWSKALENLAESHDDWQSRERAKVATDMLTSMAAPTNALMGNPEAIKRAFETGGESILDGMRNYLDDLVHNRGMPSQVDRGEFRVGENLAATPGDVVFRSDVLELIQYRPQTEQVITRPLLVIPPQIGRFYFLDMGPGRSMAEFALGKGLQLFVISWRNPTAEQSGWDLDYYINAILDATDAVRSICDTDDLNTMGFCAGGITMTAMLGYLAAVADTRVHAAAYAVTLLEYESETTVGALRTRSLLEMAKRKSRTKGVITGEDLGMLFTWMRPNDLVWSYWVNNYLMGKKPPSFDILAWNADTTNMPAALHADFLEIYEHNSFCKPGEVQVQGTPIDISKITIDTLITGGISDHLTPWQGCYQTTQLLGGDNAFVLSNSGHIASLVNPPGNPKASYLLGGETGPDPESWRATATRHNGSWWEYWSDWLKLRGGPMKPAPAATGSAEYPPIEPSPGTYVHN